MKPPKKPKSKGTGKKPTAAKGSPVGAALAAAMNGGGGGMQPPPSMGPGAGMGNYPNMGM